jgi:hypothetical protein
LAIVIQPYTREHEPAVADFNRRLQAAVANPDLVFYQSSQPRWLPRSESASLYNEFFVAADNGMVRGGYALKHQIFSFSDGTVRPIAYYHHPLSEGIVDPSHALVGSLLLRHAMQRSPLLYCLGMGGYDRPLPKMLVALGWSHCLIPFYIRVVHPYRFLREMEALRNSVPRRLAMDAAAFSGTGWLAWKAQRIFAGIKTGRADGSIVEENAEFSQWADALWEQNRQACTLTAVRDSATLQHLYPDSQTHLIRLRFKLASRDIGWAVIGEKRKDAKYGRLRVGSIIDCWSSSDNAPAVVRGATTALEKRGVDLIVSNQGHRFWCAAFESAGFIRAQSNFIFAASKKLAEFLQPFEKMKSQIHFTRADGDGLPRNF